jgi:hypothetical protein
VINNTAQAVGTVAGIAPVTSPEETVDSNTPTATVRSGATGIAQVPALHGRALALLALLIGGLAWFAQRKMRR